MNAKQREIIAEVAAKHGLKKQEVYNIWKSQFKFVHETTRKEIQRQDDGTFREEDFKVFMLPFFGKFMPKLGTIRTLNKAALKRHEDKNSKGGETMAPQEEPESDN